MEIYKMCKAVFLEMGFTKVNSPIKYEIIIIDENNLISTLSGGTSFPAWCDSERKKIMLHPPNSKYVDFSTKKYEMIISSFAHEMCHIIKKENELRIPYFESIYDNYQYEDTLEEIFVSYIAGVLLPLREQLPYSPQLESLNSLINDKVIVDSFISVSPYDFLFERPDLLYAYTYIVVYYYQSNYDINSVQNIFLSKSDNELIRNIELNDLEKEKAVELLHRSLCEK